MKYEYIDFVPVADDEDDRKQLCCPVCKTVLVDVQHDEADIKDGACKHFMFSWVLEADDPSCYNGLTKEILYKKIVDKYKSLNSEDVWEEMDTDEIVSEVLFDEDFWAQFTMDEVDTVLDHTQGGVACGPVSQTVLFGVRGDR